MKMWIDKRPKRHGDTTKLQISDPRFQIECKAQPLFFNPSIKSEISNLQSKISVSLWFWEF
jgi:hypothetical protein